MDFRVIMALIIRSRGLCATALLQTVTQPRGSSSSLITGSFPRTSRSLCTRSLCSTKPLTGNSCRSHLPGSYWTRSPPGGSSRSVCGFSPATRSLVPIVYIGSLSRIPPCPGHCTLPGGGRLSCASSLTMSHSHPPSDGDGGHPRRRPHCSFDYLVIGGGSGGLASARRAAELGARAAVVESNKLGGTCVNVGCVPKKIMWNAAIHSEGIHDLEDYGFQTSDVKFTWKVIKDKRDAYVSRLNDIYQNNLHKAQIEIIRGHAAFTSDPEPTLEVNGQKYTAPNILIATGGRPSAPSDTEVPGASLGITSDGFFELEELPRRSVIVGAGYIAVEIAGILSALGSRAALLIRQDKVLRTFDTMISTNCTEELENAGVDVWKHAEGLELDEKSHIVVDEFQNTSRKGVYAVGDVCGRALLTPG
ncbi:hypothetical protein FKM82_000934, partial [Ascaphus truei]